MRWQISPHLHLRRGSHPDTGARGHDPRALDVLAIIVLLTLAAGSGWYLAISFATPPSTTAFIVPSQSVRW